MQDRNEQILMAQSQFRHGDIAGHRVASVPATATKRVEKNILARGEHSGHSHMVTGTDFDVLTDPNDPTGAIYVTARSADVQIRHLMEKTGVWTEEHHGIQLPEGSTFRVVGQVEYDPFADAVSRVAD